MNFHLIYMMKILFLLIVSLSSLKAYSIEWDQKAFKESLYKYKKNIEKAIDNPSEYKDEMIEKYEAQFNEIKNELNKEKDEVVKKLEDERIYYVFRDLSHRGLDYLYVKDGYTFVHYVKRDSIDLFYFLDDVSDDAPFIAPMKRELHKRMDFLEFQGYFYRSAIKNAIRKK